MEYIPGEILFNILDLLNNPVDFSLVCSEWKELIDTFENPCKFKINYPNEILLRFRNLISLYLYNNNIITT